MLSKSFALGLVIGLAGCASQAEQRADVIDTARKHCEAEGKTFAVKQVEQSGDAMFSDMKTMVSGYCLGPGEKLPPDAAPQ
ncbi:MAG TPA: hypothetical protein VIM02_08340 [Rhizomicrobium sp.]|jgi:hypothetical protein